MTMRLGTAQVIQGNALALPLPDSSVDLICTSPPYFGLRSYQDAGAHYEGQIGSEATPAEFLEALLAATREMVRVLKPSGSIFVNLGDKYAGGAGDQGGKGRTTADNGYSYRGGKSDAANLAPTQQNIKYEWGGIRPKSLMGIPWRYAINCIDELGLILRAEIIWAKPNGLPESVTDRVRRNHEQWFHMVKQPRYFSAIDEIREEHTSDNRGKSWDQRKAEGVTWTPGIGTRGTHMEPGQITNGNMAGNPLGKLPGSVWTVPTQPLTVPPELGVDHFAAYPMEWPRRIIQGWTPNGICTVCGEGRRPVSEISYRHKQNDSADTRTERNPDNNRNPVALRLGSVYRDTTITGYMCACTPYTDHPERRGKDFLAGADRTKAGRSANSSERNRAYREGTSGPSGPIHEYHLEDWTPAPTTPAVVLDPFGGTGTTALVAKALGRTGITIDLSADYCRLAEWRVNDPRELAAALQVEKPEPIHPDQLDLFSEIT